ncbi:winged helix-turn-helix transcriptional regulator [Halapricum hydrolyticum]|uniref:Winged helix-turn-helix transcriptional regulator n=1 Tax=Halapricum hydrolyticum TaxID=2979991 RepID=A0AAE3IB59_9EURY|nr:winged helix-turn-helix transcriptional regulator [Halapricum hydrolyticum]MCU4717590.1 winged helix-turn-helix transcriptional regulator [Halapricum hydrolyticum]MCU4726881.1 winged helix-turn-helix transcriptional regulator [Halapricum hydrolyticum]
MPDDIREVLCRKWALEVLRFLFKEGTQNYSQIEAEFETSSDVVVKRLQELASAGLLSRQERGPKDVRYTITADGRELIALVDQISQLLEE